MHEVAGFLRRHPPFDALEPAEVERIAATAEIEFFAAGTEIIPPGSGPPSHVRVVRRGAVELLDSDRVLDLLGPGDLLGDPVMLAGLPAGLAARASEDTLCYRLAADAAGAARAASAGAAGAGGDPEFAGDRPVGALLSGPAVVCPPDTPIREAVRRMGAGSASAVVVPGARDGLGILTDRDLRTRVIGGGIGIDAPVSAAMTVPARTIAADRPASEATVEMLEHGVRHLPVVSGDGEVLGVVEDIDLLALDARMPFRLRREIERAADVPGVARAAERLGPMTIALHESRLATTQVTAMISVVVEALTCRLLDLAVAEHGEPPAPVTWLALGSHARREAVPGSDIDCAAVWIGDDEDRALRASVRALAERVMDGLRACGLAADDYGVTAARPLFARSLDAWKAAIRDWIADPGQEKALVLSSMLFDSRAIWGDPRGAALHEAFEGIADRRGLLRLQARFALTHRPPTGFLRDIVVESSGEHAGRFDIKHGGLLPIAGLARYAGMAAGSIGGSTADRLRAAAAAGTLEPDDAAVLGEAYELVLGLRLAHQVDQMRAGAAPDDFVDPAELNPLTRRYLREAFRAVARLQKAIATELDHRVR